ncbi:Protein kinase-like domain protein [Niveomyces insectorum RCEF 264]|uniref:non-specific serine/threonine protein kinase n=1 Tax=Niveomyces insectorum RCEF 264 TaxID=1081102 RepID=A0A167WVK5_9HYPO|nr:Protein kinase-like domain protein [Niveomyces insectorum RCEF 264]
MALSALLALINIPAARLLHSASTNVLLYDDLLKLISAVTAKDFDLHRIKPLLFAALDSKSDSEIWDQVYKAVAETTPPPRPIASSLLQTPWLRNTNSFSNSAELRKHVDGVLKDELGSLYTGLTGFDNLFFGGINGLQAASEQFFRECSDGPSPLFYNGWSGWPADAKEDKVLTWFAEFCNRLVRFAEHYKPNQPMQRRLLAQPNRAIQGSTGERKLDIGFVDGSKATDNSRYHWRQILIPGELKSNPSADTNAEAWLDIGRYAREILRAQSTRRFLLGFTLCGPLMRIWEFDRLGGIASGQFNVHDDGLRFVTTVLGFLWMDEQQLGFDPTIVSLGGRQYVTIERNGIQERLVLDGVMRRAGCISGRATTCWAAHREGDSQTLVMKDSWQYTERDEEGVLLQEATERGVVNVARYYHHETVQVRGADDDVLGNVRGGLDVTKAENYRPERPMVSSSAVRGDAGSTKDRQNRSEGHTGSGSKRSSSQTAAQLPPTKRLHSASSTKAGSAVVLANRVHRRVILRDYGKPIYEASSPAALLQALRGCIEGHESLHRAGFLHRDISINNLIINEDDSTNASWPCFLIDLDLAIRVQRVGASGAKGKTGTRAFMAIGALLGEQHSFMHDLESFFWVLFWICVHYEGPGKERVVSEFDEWNYTETKRLADIKKGQVVEEGDFLTSTTENFTDYYKPLVRWVNRLRKVVFPNDKRWAKEDEGLYSQMKDILQEASEEASEEVKATSL